LNFRSCYQFFKDRVGVAPVDALPKPAAVMRSGLARQEDSCASRSDRRFRGGPAM
jgi:hypothetical protein